MLVTIRKWAKLARWWMAPVITTKNLTICHCAFLQRWWNTNTECHYIRYGIIILESYCFKSISVWSQSCRNLTAQQYFWSQNSQKFAFSPKVVKDITNIIIEPTSSGTFSGSPLVFGSSSLGFFSCLGLSFLLKLIDLSDHFFLTCPRHA